MNLPVPHRRGNQPAVDAEFERLRRSLLADVEPWPSLFTDLSALVRDVVPTADVEERDDSYLVDIDLPGVKRDDIDIEVDHGHLVVTAERTRRERVGLLRHRTRTTGRFRLALTLPSMGDEEHVTATFDDGVLTLVVPKAEAARRRRIPIGRS